MRKTKKYNREIENPEVFFQDLTSRFSLCKLLNGKLDTNYKYLSYDF